MTKWASILASIAGLALAVYAVSTHGKDLPGDPPPAASPSINPFGRGIAATGQVEGRSRNIALAAPEAGLVTEVLVSVGDQVAKDQVLMRIDSRLLEADGFRLRAAADVARARLARLQAMPRAEELVPLSAAVERSRIRFNDAKAFYEDMTRAGAREAASRIEVDRLRFSMEAAKAEWDQTEAQLRLMQAGAWEKELAVATAELALAESDLAALQRRIDRLTVVAPIAGTILKRNVEPGQYAASGPQSSPAMVLADLTELRVRARVDEEDAPLLRDGAKGVLRVRGTAGETSPLSMLRIEPLALAKTDLINSPTERVDTRVVEVVFRIDQATKARLYPGQVVDVFIDADPAKP